MKCLVDLYQILRYATIHGYFGQLQRGLVGKSLRSFVSNDCRSQYRENLNLIWHYLVQVQLLWYQQVSYLGVENRYYYYLLRMTMMTGHSASSYYLLSLKHYFKGQYHSRQLKEKNEHSLLQLNVDCLRFQFLNNGGAQLSLERVGSQYVDLSRLLFFEVLKNHWLHSQVLRGSNYEENSP